MNNSNVMNNRKMFMNWNMLHKYCGGFDIKDYNKIYDGEIISSQLFEYAYKKNLNLHYSIFPFFQNLINF